jgi:hypothetical protein
VWGVLKGSHLLGRHALQCILLVSDQIPSVSGNGSRSSIHDVSINGFHHLHVIFMCTWEKGVVTRGEEDS